MHVSHSCLVVTLIFSVACGPSMQVGRLGSSVPLPSGTPVNECETQGWHELAPTRAIAEAQVSKGLITTQYTAVVEGHGVYRPGETEPMELPPLLPAMGEPDLARAQMEPIEHVSRRRTATIGWSLGGLAGMGLGLGIGAAVNEQNSTAAAVAVVSGLVVGLVALGLALGSQPKADAQLRADTHRQVFTAEAQDWAAIERGVDRLNREQRRRCGGAVVAQDLSLQDTGAAMQGSVLTAPEPAP